MFKSSSRIVLGIGLGLSLASAGGTLTIKGSDTMLDLAQKWSSKYMASHAGTQINVSGGGSGKGITSLIDGTTDLCNASRPLKATEREKLKQRQNSLGVEFKVAKDGIGILVNAANPVKELSMSQIRGILSGKITNWKDVGGKDGIISVYTRESSSGTFGYLRDVAMSGKDFAPSAKTVTGNAAMAGEVAKDPSAIGYGELEGKSGIVRIKVKKSESSPAVELTEANVKNDSYPLTRFLYIYSASRPEGTAKEYLEWITGPEGQAIVAQQGFVPVK